MIRWSVLKRIKNHKKAVTNLMSIGNWTKAVKYSYITKYKKAMAHIKENNLFDWDKPSPPKESDWEPIIEARLQQMEAEQVTQINRRW